MYETPKSQANTLLYWDAGSGESYLYTENSTIAKVLRSEFRRYATYFRYGSVYAWQFKIRKQRLAWMRQRFEVQKTPVSETQFPGR
jgi:hypothetical protein